MFYKTAKKVWKGVMVAMLITAKLVLCHYVAMLGPGLGRDDGRGSIVAVFLIVFDMGSMDSTCLVWTSTALALNARQKQ